MSAAQFDRATRLQLLQEAHYECQLNYRVCTHAATEIADVGVLKASCKPCREHRVDKQAEGRMMATERLRRSRLV